MKNIIFIGLSLFILLSSCQKEILERATIVQAECACEEPPPPENEQTQLATVSTAFIGSSTIALYPSLETTYGIPVIRYGYSGYGILDVSNRLGTYVSPKKYRQIVVYVGDNDFAYPLSASEVIRRYKLLVDRALYQNPQAYILFISIKPSWNSTYMAGTKTANAAIKAYIEGKNNPNARYVDLFSRLIGADGKPDVQYFAKYGNIHLNNAGYELLENCLRQYMIRG